MEINKDELRIWIAALRSGEYQQGNGTLQSKNGYCCLGVACKVLIPAKSLKFLDDKLAGNYPEDQPKSPKWLRHIDLDVKTKFGIQLSELNDARNWSFNQIADLLEKLYLTDGNQ